MKLFQWQKDLLVALQHGVFYDSEEIRENERFDQPAENELVEIFDEASVFYKLHMLHLLYFIRIVAIFITSDLGNPLFWESLKKAYLVRRLYDFPVLYYQRIFRTLIAAIRFCYYSNPVSKSELFEYRENNELPSAEEQS